MQSLETGALVGNQCEILVIEPRGVINTGDVKNKLTINKDQWI